MPKKLTEKSSSRHLYRAKVIALCNHLKNAICNGLSPGLRAKARLGLADLQI